MNIQRLYRKSPISFKFLILVGLVFGITFYVLFIPPSNSIIILPLILLVSAAVYLAVSFRSTRIARLAATFIFIELLLNAFIGIDIVNTILLASFIIAVAILFK